VNRTRLDKRKHVIAPESWLGQLLYRSNHAPRRRSRRDLDAELYQTEAEVRLDLEDVKTAEPFVQSAMDGARTAYGEKSPMYGYSLTLQAWLRLLQGKKTEATRLAGEAERNLIEAGGTGTYYLPPLRKLKAELAAGR
jgi:hypothetical protein